MSVYLVRHPPTPWTGVRYLGRRDLGWSEAGRRRAGELAVGLAPRIDRSGLVITSPLRRSHALAEQLAAATGCAIEVDERWTEVDVGAIEGATFAEFEAREPMLARRVAGGALTIDWPAGERFAELERRVAVGFDEATARPESPLVIVTHAGPIAVLLSRLGCHGDTRFVRPASVLALGLTTDGRWEIQPLRMRAR
ncbi:MAG: histidine phosphatase family protein [Candidatus Limnocylindria bacterium]